MTYYFCNDNFFPNFLLESSDVFVQKKVIRNTSFLNNHRKTDRQRSLLRLTCGSFCLFAVCCCNVEMVSWFTSRGNQLHTKNMKEAAMKNAAESQLLLTCTADSIHHGMSDFSWGTSYIQFAVQHRLLACSHLHVMSLVFLSRSNLAGVSVVASPILFVATLWALAATGAAAAAHTAGTANTVSVTWDRNKTGKKRERNWKLLCKMRLAENRSVTKSEREQVYRV